jgi:hypothetical protein
MTTSNSRSMHLGILGIRPKIIGTFLAVVLVMAGLAAFAVLRLVYLSGEFQQTQQMVGESENASRLQVTAKEMQGLTYLYAQQPTDQTLTRIRAANGLLLETIRTAKGNSDRQGQLRRYRDGLGRYLRFH